MPVSPLCDRERDSSIAKSQVGFFKFICVPFYELLLDLAGPALEPVPYMQKNHKHWLDLLHSDEKEEHASNAANGTSE